jgi:hypothetical protein
MGRVVWRAEPLRPKGGEALRLIPPSEKRQFFGIFFMNRLQPILRQLQRLIP